MSKKNQVSKPLNVDEWTPVWQELRAIWREADVQQFPRFSGSAGPMYAMALTKWLSRFLPKKGRNNR
jgi:hypothetical protein